MSQSASCVFVFFFLGFLFLLLPSGLRAQNCSTGYSYQFYGADFRFNVSSTQVIGARVGPSNGDTGLPFPFRASEYTVEVWVNPYFATHYLHDGIVSTLWNTGSYQSGYGFYYDPCGVNWWVASPSSSQAPNALRFWLPRNKWSYLVGTLNGTYMHSVYLNGKLVMQKQRNNPTVYTPENLLYFGRYLDDDQDFGFNGQLDGIRIWNRAWDDAEVAHNYNHPVSYPPGTTNLLGAWDVKAGSGLTVSDRSGNGWDAKIFGPTGLGDQRPPTMLPPVQTSLASSSYWVPQNCSASTDNDCEWCVPSKIDLSDAPATSTQNYTFRRTLFSWTDPIVNGHSLTQIGSTQTNSVSMMLGFNFSFFGTTYDTVHVDKNGVLLFYAQDQLCDSDPLTSPGMPHPNGVSVLWAQNINVNNPVKLYYTTSGTPGNRRFIITWYQVTPFIDPKTNRTFQAKLYENNGQMEFQYLSMDLPDPYDQGAYATIGMCQGIGWDVPITLGKCILYRSGDATPYVPTQSGIIVCNANDNSSICDGIVPSPVVNGTAGTSSSGALIGGILGGFLGFLFLLLIALVLGIIVYLAYRRWKDKQIIYLREEENHRNSLTTKYREIEWSELDLLELLGAGAFGRVYKGKWRGATVAVKVCTDFQLAMMTEDTIENIRQEACLMELLGNHPNVISFVGAVTKGDYFALVTEYCPYGSMYDLFIAKKKDLRKPVTREMLIRMLRDAARGILHLHSEHVIHRDISARNMLVAKDTTVRVTDFGLSRLRQDTEGSYATTKSNVGPVKWMAPEAITKRIYSEKSDSWSFGVLVWEMVTQSEPWQNVALLDIAIGVGRKGWTLKIPKNCDPFFKRLMKDCWRQRPEKRPSFQEIEARLSAELGGDDSDESTVESDHEEEDVPSIMKKKRDSYEYRADVTDMELDEMEAMGYKKKKKKKKSGKKTRRKNKNDGLEVIKAADEQQALGDDANSTSVYTFANPYDEVDTNRAGDEASDESGKDGKDIL